MSVLLVASLVWPVISSVVNGLSGRGVRRAGRGYMAENFYFLYIVLTISKLLIILITSLDLK